MCFIDGLVDKDTINEYIIKALAMDFNLIEENIGNANIHISIKENILSASEVKEIKLFNEVINLILDGEVALFIDNNDTVLMIDVKKWASRSISEPNTEVE